MQAGAAWQKERPIRSNIETRSTKVAAPESSLTARFGVTPREARGAWRFVHPAADHDASNGKRSSDAGMLRAGVLLLRTGRGCLRAGWLQALSLMYLSR